MTATTTDVARPAVDGPPPIQAPTRAQGGARRWRKDIQGLRAVAVLAVVLYHAGVPHLGGGYIGVDVFFVISGFLITGHLVRDAKLHGRVNYLAFYGSRARRLLPSAALVTVVTVVVDRACSSIFQVKAIAWDAIFAAFYGLNWRLAAQGINYQEGSGRVSPFQHFWSLAVEEQFYIAWPLIIGLCLWLGGRWRWRLLAAVLVTITAVSLFESVTVTAQNQPLGYFSLQTRAWELGVGAGLALAAPYLALLPAGIAGALSWAGLAGITYSAVMFNDKTLFPGWAALVPVLSAAVFIAAGCATRQARWAAETPLSNPVTQGIGKGSYAWYLWHWPMLVLLPAMFGQDFSWQLQVTVVVLGGWFAVLSYNLIERQVVRSRAPLRRWLASGLGLSVATAAVGAIVLTSVPTLVGGSAAATVQLTGDAPTAVNHALMGALAARDVPRNLTPSLEHASNDQPASTGDGCHLGYLAMVQPRCLYGDPGGASTAVLLGDSHAQQWLPGLDMAAKANGWRLYGWTKAACPLADVRIVNDTLHREFSECDTWRQLIVKRVIDLRPQLVIIGQSDTVVGTQVSNARWAEATAKAAKAIQDAGIKVTYLLDTPYHASGTPECLAAHLHNAGACTIKAADSYPYRNRRSAVAAALNGAHVPTVSAEPWVCASGACPPVVGNTLVYRDATHITAHYSRLLAPVLAGLLKR